MLHGNYPNIASAKEKSAEIVTYVPINYETIVKFQLIEICIVYLYYMWMRPLGGMHIIFLSST